MRYSVFDWNARQYQVYEDGRVNTLMGDAPTCRAGAQKYLGMLDVNMSLCEVPADAYPIGNSEVAVGRVARLSNGMLGVVNQGRAGSPNLGGLNGLGGGLNGGLGAPAASPRRAFALFSVSRRF